MGHATLRQIALLVAIGCACAPNSSWAQEDHELAKQLANPIASLISVPFQSNWDTRIGPARDGDRYYLNFQPVIPISLDKDWNLISRTILPLISQRNIFPGAGDQTGIGDTTQSFFFSPKSPGPFGVIWGVGPALFIPSDSDRLLSSGKWGAGPTGVALIQEGGWTIGILSNQNWSFAGEDNRPDVNRTFLQPFISYTTKDAWTFTLDTSRPMIGWLTNGRCRSISRLLSLSNLALSPSNSRSACDTGLKTPTRVRMTSARGSTSSSCSPLGK